MPTYRYSPQNEALTSYQPDLDNWAALINDPMYRASFDLIFTARALPETPATSESLLQAIPDRTLNRHDRLELHSLYESLSNSARGEAGMSGGADGDFLSGAATPRQLGTGSGDLLGELRRNSDSLYADAARDPIDAPAQIAANPDETNPFFTSDPSGAAATTGNGGSLNLRPRAPGQSLADMPLGALGAEALRPLLRASDLIAGSLNDLRQYVLIEQPKSSTLMMMDNNSGQALVMQSTGNFSPGNFPRDRLTEAEAALNGERGQSSAASSNVLDFLNKPLKQLLWDIFSSEAALLIYALLFVAWLAWRKVISRHV